MALPKKNRLEKKEDFSRVFKSGIFLRESFLGVKFLKNNAQQNRFGVVVSGKVSKKRVLGVLKEFDRFKKNNFDIIVTTAPSIVGKTFQEIKGALDRATEKIRRQQ